jgi:MYXO-CTERM domain-containing protein
VTSLVAHDTSGVELWRRDLPQAAGLGYPGAYVADFNGDKKPDLLVRVQLASDVDVLAIYDGLSGSLVRSTPLPSISAGTNLLLTGALADLTGDGVPELIAPTNPNVLAINVSSDPMSLLWSADGTSIGIINGSVGAAQLDDDSAIDLFRVNGSNGLGPYARISDKGIIDAHADQGLPLQHDYDQNGVALVRRTKDGTVFDLVAAGSRDVGLSRVRRIAGDTMNTVWTVYASEGVVSAAPPERKYSLHNPIEMDVDGDGEEEVVFGSDDGYLYAVNSSDGQLAFKVDLGAPIANVIAANVDGDPALELVASTTDGNLIALDEPGHYVAPRDLPEAGVDASSDAGEAGPAGDASFDGTGPDSTDGGTGEGSSLVENDEVAGGGCGCRVATPRASWRDRIGFVLVALAFALRRRKAPTEGFAS